MAPRLPNNPAAVQQRHAFNLANLRSSRNTLKKGRSRQGADEDAATDAGGGRAQSQRKRWDRGVVGGNSGIGFPLWTSRPNQPTIDDR
jgi:hypothetical protein